MKTYHAEIENIDTHEIYVSDWTGKNKQEAFNKAWAYYMTKMQAFIIKIK